MFPKYTGMYRSTINWFNGFMRCQRELKNVSSVDRLRQSIRFCTPYLDSALPRILQIWSEVGKLLQKQNEKVENTSTFKSYLRHNYLKNYRHKFCNISGRFSVRVSILYKFSSTYIVNKVDLAIIQVKDIPSNSLSLTYCLRMIWRFTHHER